MVQSMRKPPPKWLRVVSLAIATAVPVVFMTLGISGLAHVRHEQSLLRPIPGGILTAGTVLSSHESCYHSCTYEPQIQYTDRNGGVHTFTAPYQSDYPAVDSSVQVSYSLTNPSYAHDISNGPSSWSIELFTSVFLISISGLYLLIGGTVGIRLWRKRAKTRTSPVVATVPGGSGHEEDR